VIVVPKQPNNQIAGEFFNWNLFKRDGVWYADGRRNTPNLGKCSLGTRDWDEALRKVHALDRRKAFELKLVSMPPAEAQLAAKERTR
jgi:hypothetical protein